MKMTVYAGWLMIVVGVVIGIGAVVAGQALFGAIMLVSLAGAGAFMVWLASGWDTPLDDAQDLYKYGRPANATVTSVEDQQARPDGVATAKVSLQVAPVNESEYKTTRVLALPGGNTPAVGSRVTVKFDPNSRKNVVLLDENYEVEDGIAVARRNMQLMGTPGPQA
jgi:hypothetical protein